MDTTQLYIPSSPISVLIMSTRESMYTKSLLVLQLLLSSTSPELESNNFLDSDSLTAHTRTGGEKSLDHEHQIL